MVPGVLRLRSTERALPEVHATTISGKASPFKSPKTTPYGPLATPKSTLAANDPLLISPGELVLRSTETVFAPVLAAIISALPLPSTSPIATATGCEPTVKSTRLFKLIVPGKLRLWKTDTLLVRL